jgi:hypothetical protein
VSANPKSTDKAQAPNAISNTMWRLSVVLKDRNCDPNSQIPYLLDCGLGEAKQRTSGQGARAGARCGPQSATADVLPLFETSSNSIACPLIASALRPEIWTNTSLPGAPSG